MNTTEEIWYRGIVLRQAFKECKLCLKDVYSKIDKILRSPLCDVSKEFNIAMDRIPEGYFSLRKNIFSTLFQSVYQLLGIEKKRRMLYGKINHLFRIWVTSADNLLDDEDKVAVPMRMPGNSRTMRQVISIMVADRIMEQLLEEAIGRCIISSKDSEILSEKSLQILLPSAAEEASEEGGISERTEPGHVLHTIHRLKTGLLFHIPFLGPESIEDNIDIRLLNRCKEALDKFGLGCQLLDDIRDMAKDYLEKRHNYVLSRIYWENRISYIEHLKKLEGEIDGFAKISSYFPEVIDPTAELAKKLLQEGLFILDEVGLGVGECFANTMVFSMFDILDVGELVECLNTEETVKTKEYLLQAAPLTT